MLAGGAERVAQLGHGEPVRLPRQQPRGGGGGRVDGARREVDAVPLDDQAPPDQLPELGPVDTVRRGRVGAGRLQRQPGTGGRPAGRERRPGGPGRRRRRRRARGRARPAPARRGRRRRGRAGRRPRSVPRGPRPSPRPRRARPPTARRSAGRRSPVTASSSSAAIHPRSATTRSVTSTDHPPAAPSTPGGPARRRGSRRRPRSRCGRTPAGRSGRPGSSGTGWSRWRRTKPCDTGRDGRAAEDPHRHRVLARAEVRRVGAPTGHVVVEVGEDGQRGVEADRSAANGRARRRRRPGPPRSCSTPDQVERHAVAGPDALRRPR